MREYRDMMEEIERQGSLISDLKTIEEAVEKACAEILGNGKNKKIFLLGCGDSYFAGLAVKNYFLEKTDCLCFPMTALEFSVSGIRQVDGESTVIAVSMSGNVARTVEAVKTAQERGAYVVGITNSLTGRLYGVCSHPIYLGLKEEPGWTPGTLTYTGTLYALYRLAAGLSKEGERRTCLNRLTHVMGQIANTVEKCRETAREAGENLVYNRHSFPVYVLGAGPSFATAKYGAAKFLEICDVTAIGQESEEFAHQEFWVIDKNCPVFLVAPEGENFQRTKEVGECLRQFGCDLFVISSDAKLRQMGKYAFAMPEDVEELYAPLLYAVPMQLTAYYFSKKRGLDPDRRSHNDPFRKRVSRMLTRGTVNLD